MLLKQRRATPHRLIAKATKAFLLVLCLAVLPAGCSSISRLQEFPEPPQVFGGTRQNFEGAGMGMFRRSFDFFQTVVIPISGGTSHSFGAGAAMAGLLLLPLVLPVVIVEIPLTLAADVVVLPVSIPAERWWYSQNEGPPDEPEVPGLEEGEVDLESIEDIEAAEGAGLADEQLDALNRGLEGGNLELEDPPGDD